jgi:hypothetical protein
MTTSRAKAVSLEIYFLEDCMLKKAILLFCVCLLAASPAAFANTIVDSTLGVTYTVAFSTVATDSYDVYLLVNTTTPSGSLTSSDFLNAVALKLLPQSSDYSSITLESVLMAPAPGTAVSSFTTPATPQTNGLNANGCAGGGNGFFCDPANIVTGAPVDSTNDIYLFTWLVNTTAGNELTAGGSLSVKALYVDGNGKQVGITSQDATLTPGGSPFSAPPTVPEPTPFVLLGTGLIAAAKVIKTRLSA